MVTPRKTVCYDSFLCEGVTCVTKGVTRKTIDRDIIYSIVTPVTPIFSYSIDFSFFFKKKPKKKFSRKDIDFRCNWCNQKKNKAMHSEKTVTPEVTRVTPEVV